MTLRFTVEHPVGQHGCAPELYQQDGLAAFVRAAEDSGFDAVAFTEHPAPSLKWLQAGGHESLDPLTALAFTAAVTSRIKLMTYLLVLPYRNPLITAKMIATVDLLSQGRLIVGAGGGYLRSEFFALGVDFEERGALFDEAIDVIRQLWAGEALTVEGRHFTARGQVSTPRPAQQPHPPIWIGGNGKNARRRVARAADGWMPLLVSEELAATTRMPALATVPQLAAAIDELREMLTGAGRDPASVGIQVQGRQGDLLVHRENSWEEHHDFLGQLTDAGVTDVVIRTTGSGVDAAVDALQEYGREGIAAHRK
ncbi:MAG TPA: LLM class F420-dependent oxidoreductase [Blastococcus sp.]|nr:LLM class F420-dependent oxidoreductase [Blastococcus sp.]